MGVLKDLIGKQFGKLIVLELESIRKGRSYWKCQCSCGNQTIVYNSNLQSGATVSCGCRKKEYQFKKENNVFDLSGESGICYTKSGMYFLFDKDDYNKIKKHCWFPEVRSNGKIYFRANLNNGKKIYVHRLILKNPHNKDIDHKNLNYSDCRKESLRVCSRAENSQNQAKRNNTSNNFKGITFNRDLKKWQAQITVNYKHISLGYFNTEEEAHAVYCTASKKYHGEYGRTA